MFGKKKKTEKKDYSAKKIVTKKVVSIRLIHAKEPGPAFCQDFDKYPALIEGIDGKLL